MANYILVFKEGGLIGMFDSKNAARVYQLSHRLSNSTIILHETDFKQDVSNLVSEIKL